MPIGYEWFDQRQRGLVELASTWWGREFLRLPAECEGLPVVALWPNAVHVALPDGQRRAVFYSRPVFAERVRRFAQWERRYGALGAALRASDPRLQMIELAVANSGTFNPDANVESTTVDGWVRGATPAGTWASIRGGAGSQSNDLDTTIIVGQVTCTANPNEFSVITRAAYLFNTSTLLSTAVVTAATFSLYGQSVQNDLGLSIGVVTSTPAANTAIVDGDYQNFGTTRQADTDIALSAWSTVAYNDWVLNATGRSTISTTGITKLGTRTDKDIDNNPPGWVSSFNGYGYCYAADNGSNKPKLVVTYWLNGAAMLIGTLI